MLKKLFSRFRIPHVFIFLSGIILFCSVLTYIIPSGNYQRVTKRFGDMERNVVVPGTYEQIPKHFSIKGFILGDPVEGKASATSILGIFTAIPKGMSQSAALIFFIFIIGAVFNLLQDTGTINAIIFKIMDKFSNTPVLLPVIIFTIVALGSTLLGMGTEFIPMIPIFLVVSKSLGYDRLYGVSLLLLAEGVGWTSGITNPFNVQIAQQLAEVPIGSGIGFRVIFFIVCYSIGLGYFLWYGKKVKSNPSSSIMKDDPFSVNVELGLKTELEKKHLLIAFVAIAILALVIYAVQTMGWGLFELSGGFLAVGVCTILIYGMSGDKAMESFINGLKLMIVPALIVGVARGIQVVMEEGQIIDTILHHAAGVLQEQPKWLAVQGMFAFQSSLNFFIPSASGQALVTMPLLVPLSDLLNVSRQMAVFTFLIGDGMSNIIIPTNGFLMAVLGIAGVPFEKWFKFIFPVFLLLVIFGLVFLSIALYINY